MTAGGEADRRCVVRSPGAVLSSRDRRAHTLGSAARQIVPAVVSGSGVCLREARKGHQSCARSSENAHISSAEAAARRTAKVQSHTTGPTYTTPPAKVFPALPPMCTRM